MGKLTAPIDDTGHIWHERVYASMKLLCCMNCGFIKNLDKPNAPCPGAIGVEVRAALTTGEKL